MSDPMSSETVASLMAGFRRGDKTSADRLMEILYPELRRLAAARMRRERSGHSWQPTLLVNELYLELARRKSLGGDAGEDGAQERAAFLGLAGFLMRRLLIQHSRPLRQRMSHVEVDEAELPAISNENNPRLVEELLSGLEAIDPRIRSVVELRVFEGMTNEEIAGQLGCSSRSVQTYWSFARRWLESRMSVSPGGRIH
jgi:RNA polymerase sigma factor (TIGR02999 family)